MRHKKEYSMMEEKSKKDCKKPEGRDRSLTNQTGHSLQRFNTPNVLALPEKAPFFKLS